MPPPFKKVISGILLLHGLCAGGQNMQPADYVNPFIGASTSAEAAGVYHGLGKTYPGAVAPFGMVQVSPNTITGGDNGSGYSYEHTTIEGFAFTQMSGVGWFGDLGNFLVMPTAGELQTAAGKPSSSKYTGYRSAYDKVSEKASAGYYAVKLTDHNIYTEATAAPHSGMLRFTFPANKLSRIQIDLARRVGGTSTSQYVHVLNDSTIEGWMHCTPEGGGWGNGEGKANYTVYFYTQFSKPLLKTGIYSAHIPDTANRKREAIESDYYQQWIANATVIRNASQMEGKHIGFFTEFETKAGEQVVLKSGISFVSIEGARKNLEKEIEGWDFDRVHSATKQLWNEALQKISIEGANEEQNHVFYTALYHTLLDPRNISDVDGKYYGGDLSVHYADNFKKRTIFSGWDVFRSEFPLLTIIRPDVVNDVINSLVTMADQSGQNYLERWEILNAYSGCMLGNPAVVVLADAYNKGIRGYDADKAFLYAVNTVEKFGNGKKGYTVPVCIANTLEYAFADWSLSQMARKMNKHSEAEKYAARSMDYKNIFDTTHNWFRPRNEDGSWVEWPKEGRMKDWYGTFETNPYQQGWFVPHDVDGMVQLMGGRKKVIADLDSFFARTPEDFMWNDFYNHANEPVHHVPYLYNRLNEPWKTQQLTRKICKQAYKNAVDGLVGNEDVGQMSAWYVLSSIGLHPLAPGGTRFEITSPMWQKTQLNISTPGTEKKMFTVIAHSNSNQNVYIQKALLNGKPYHSSSIEYVDIMAGGTLELFMGSSPEKNWFK